MRVFKFQKLHTENKSDFVHRITAAIMQYVYWARFEIEIISHVINFSKSSSPNFVAKSINVSIYHI